MEVSENALNPGDPGEPGLLAMLGVPDPGDVCLAPHSDDACFSLGHLLARRRAGTVLTVFPVSGYVAAGVDQLGDVVAVTRRRLSEEHEFARRAGVLPRCLDFPEAHARREPIFGGEGAGATAARIASTLFAALRGPRLGMRPKPRPWLFCPAGIGGHVDHLAVLLAVVGWRPLRSFYRLAFYEDLHYASRAAARVAGLQRLARLTGGLALRRLRHDLGHQERAEKMALVRCYPSQLERSIATIEAYRPAVADAAIGPHEAVWIPQDDLRQSSG